MPHILIVDDDPELAELARRIISRAIPDCQLSYAANGKQALDLLDIAPDLILLDDMMPLMDGFEFLRYAQTDTSLAHIPIIVWTSMTSADNIVALYQLNATAVFTKPLASMNTFIHTIKTHLGLLDS